MSGLDRDRQLLTRAAGGFIRVLCGEERDGGTGGSCPVDLFSHKGGRIDYDAKGIRYSYSTPSDPMQLVQPTVTWAALREHGASLPSSTLDLIRDHLRRYREHQAKYPTYPNRKTDPDQWARCEAYFRNVHMPEFRALVDEAGRIGDAAYPLTVDHEPTDLLELLAVMA